MPLQPKPDRDVRKTNGKATPQKDMLKEIQCERSALDDSLAPLSAGQMTMLGVPRGGWSIRDVLADLCEW